MNALIMKGVRQSSALCSTKVESLMKDCKINFLVARIFREHVGNSPSGHLAVNKSRFCSIFDRYDDFYDSFLVIESLICQKLLFGLRVNCSLLEQFF